MIEIRCDVCNEEIDVACADERIFLVTYGLRKFRAIVSASDEDEDVEHFCATCATEALTQGAWEEVQP